MTASNLQHTCVVGLVWGDEGKGKIVDLLCESADVVVRYNGGANAGHTVCIADQEFALHLLPTGVLRENVTGVIGPGVVVDPVTLLEEIDGLQAKGLPVAERLKISERAHLVMPYHKIEDKLSEAAAGDNKKIGTTARGIGPCYADKMRRTTAIRAGELLDPSRLIHKLQDIVQHKQKYLQGAYGSDGELNPESICDMVRNVAERIRPMIDDTTSWLAKAVTNGKKLFFEGANGMLLDIDHGTYPFVTSSHPGPAGIPSGAGVPTTLVASRVGVTKAYSTRVGSGPFPTELANKTGDQLREQGHEYGTTTGRPRRCGWLDLVAVKYSAWLGGITDLAITHLDTLSGFDEVGICTGYRVGDQVLDSLPASADTLAEAKPIFEMHQGWSGNLRDVRSFEDLPEPARKYIGRIEQFVGAPATVISVGPARRQTIIRHDKWNLCESRRA